MTRPPNTPSARGHLSLSPGSALTRPGWCALKTTGRPMPRATTCPTSTRSSANPRREDSVRLTALRTGQVHLIDAMAYADVERFQKSHERQIQPLAVAFRRHLCGLQLHAAGRFRTSACAPPRRTPSTAMPSITRCFTSRAPCSTSPTPWQPLASGEPQPGVRSRQGQSLAQAGTRRGYPAQDLCNANTSLQPRDVRQVVQELWNSVGFKVTLEPLDTVPFLKCPEGARF